MNFDLHDMQKNAIIILTKKYALYCKYCKLQVCTAYCKCSMRPIIGLNVRTYR